MPSLDFDIETSNFRSFYDQNLARLENAKLSFAALITALLTYSSDIQFSKIEGRVKDREECVQKFSRKYRSACEEKGEPYEIAPRITDLIGLRVVLLYNDQLKDLRRLIEQHFEIIDETDKSAALESTEGVFGYKGLHLDLKLKEPRNTLPEYKSYADVPFELQIRTIVQDSWSVLDHKIKYKKSIPHALKRRINVLAALFELADSEFREIRNATEVALREAPDATIAAEQTPCAQADIQAQPQESDLNAFTFLKIAQHFFKDFDFEPYKVDGFVEEIIRAEPGMTRARFNKLMGNSWQAVRKYRQLHQEQHGPEKFNAYTTIRHCLYLQDKEKFQRLLTNAARGAFDEWLEQHCLAEGASAAKVYAPETPQPVLTPAA